MKNATTAKDSIAQSQTSYTDKVKIEVEPKRVLHTSPDRFVETEKIFMSR